MALVLSDEYANTTAPVTAMPYGSFKNATSPSVFDGTPLEKAWQDDWYGFLSKLLNDSNITPSGVPDTVVASDYFDGLDTLFSRFFIYDDGGSANVIQLTSLSGVNPKAYSEGLPIRFKLANDTTGATTLEIGTLGAVPVTLEGAAITNELKAGRYYDGVYRTATPSVELVTNITTGLEFMIDPPAYSTKFNYSADNFWWGDSAGATLESPFTRTKSMPVSDTEIIAMRGSVSQGMARAKKSDHITIWSNIYSAMTVGAAAVNKILAYYYDTVDNLIYAIARNISGGAYLISINPATGAYTDHGLVVSGVAAAEYYFCMLDRVGAVEGVGDFLFTYKANDADDNMLYVRLTTAGVVTSGTIRTEDSYSPGSFIYYTADTKILLVALDAPIPDDNTIQAGTAMYVRRGGNERVIHIPKVTSDLGATPDINVPFDGGDTRNSIDLWAGDVALTNDVINSVAYQLTTQDSKSVLYYTRSAFDEWLSAWCDHERMNPGTAFTLA